MWRNTFLEKRRHSINNWWLAMKRVTVLRTKQKATTGFSQIKFWGSAQENATDCSRPRSVENTNGFVSDGWNQDIWLFIFSLNFSPALSTQGAARLDEWTKKNNSSKNVSKQLRLLRQEVVILSRVLQLNNHCKRQGIAFIRWTINQNAIVLSWKPFWNEYTSDDELYRTI